MKTDFLQHIQAALPKPPTRHEKRAGIAAGPRIFHHRFDAYI
ncbi:hypothetical protein [Chromobacterium sp. ASV23]|nr:hypothetical protein [Chromobacterium sp. ASV23]